MLCLIDCLPGQRERKENGAGKRGRKIGSLKRINRRNKKGTNDRLGENTVHDPTAGAAGR